MRPAIILKMRSRVQLKLLHGILKHFVYNRSVCASYEDLKVQISTLIISCIFVHIIINRFIFRSSTSVQESSSNTHPPEPAAKQEFKNPPNATTPQNGKPQQRVGTGRVVKPKKEIKDSDYKGFTRPRNYQSSKVDQKAPPPRKSNKDSDFIHSQNFTNKSRVQELETDMNRLSVQDASSKNVGKQSNQRQGSVPPRLQGEQKSSKRYSSLRQRSLPETAAPPFGQHPQGYYPNGTCSPKDKLL